MPLANIRKDLEEVFEAGWNTADAEIVYSAVGEVESPPFIRLHIQPGASFNVGVGPNCPPTRTGFASVMIFIATTGGLGLAWELADKVKNIFENKRVNGIRLFETSTYDRGSDKGLYIFEATTYYEVEEP